MVNSHTDSSVAKSFAARRGLGKMRHLEVKPLWLQECVRHGKIAVQKIAGSDSVADVLTKYHGKEDLERVLAGHGVVSGQDT